MKKTSAISEKKSFKTQPVILLSALCISILFFLVIPNVSYGTVEGKPCDPEPTAMTIRYGDLVICQVEEAGDLDIFRFSADMAESIFLKASWHSGDGYPCIELFAPDGSQVGTAQCRQSSRIDAVIAQTGSYTALIYDNDNDETFTYALGLERLSPPTITATAIEFGVNINDEINPEGDSDLFFFQGTNGDKIILQLARLSGGIMPCIALFGPDGSQVGTSQCTIYGDPRIDAAIAETGLHTVLIYEAYNSRTFSYNLSVQCISGQCVPPPSILTCISGDTDEDGDVDILDVIEALRMAVGIDPFRQACVQ